MTTRTRTLASFFSVAMASMIVGAVISTQVQRPETAQAQTSGDKATTSAVPRRGDAVITLDTFKEVSRRVNPGVVNISTQQIVKRSSDPLRDFFGEDFSERFGGPRGGRSGKERKTSLGSGFVVDKDGYILTNRHVVSDETSGSPADEIEVELSNGKKYQAKLIGRDARTDVALLKIDAKEPLTVVEMGDSDQTEPGEWVIAIGNPFGLANQFGGGNSVTVGVVSYKGRSIPLEDRVGTPVEMIQTDASINPGNSGGPLLNLRGQVIGINTLIITRGLPQSAGVGFAVPINVAKDILPQLRDKGKVVRGWLGVSIGKVDDDLAKTFGMKESKGALVNEVTPSSPADKAGLKAEDVIVTVDGKDVTDNSFLSRYIASRPPGSTVKLSVLRGSKEQAISVTLGTFPDETSEDSNDEEKKTALGMTPRTLTPTLAEQLDLPRTAKGVVVMDVEAGEAADDAGLQRGDLIVSVGGVEVDDVDAFKREIDKARKDGLARLRVRRGGAYFFRVLKLS
jgi:serine protease Do